MTFKTGVSRLTTQNFDGAAGISNALSKVKNVPSRLIARLLDKIDFLTTEIFGDKMLFQKDIFDFIDEEIDEFAAVAA